MTPQVALLSMVFGVLWHTLLFLLLGGVLGVAAFGGILAGAVAGLCAGSLTMRSRQRHQGRESVLDGVVTYYAAVAVYALGLVILGFVFEVFTADEHLGPLELLCASWALTGYAVLFATLMGVVLVPLCFLTRRLLWRFAGRMRPRHDG